MREVKRISLWSGPRNISTALMYSFAQREDTSVEDEPLYAHYLKVYPKAQEYHPGAKDVLNTMEQDGRKVIENMLSVADTPVYFFKNMTHHLVDVDLAFTKELVNVILTRDPQDMLPSFAKVIENPSIEDVGYSQHLALAQYFHDHEIPFIVLDSKKILMNPEEELTRLCDFAGIPFDAKMLAWEAGQRQEDGSWAKYWYGNVHTSTGFQKYRPKTEPFPLA